MEALSICALVFGPAVIGIFALVMAIRVSSPSKTADRAVRMVGSFVLLLVAYGIGCCYLGIFTTGFGGRPDRTQTHVLAAVMLGGLALLSFGWLYRASRQPRPAPGADGEVAPDGRGLAMFLIVVLALLGGAAVFAAISI